LLSLLVTAPQIGMRDSLAECLPLHTFTGEAAGDYFGSSISGAGDVDADGYDVIVGAFSSDVHGSYTGRAYVYSGRTGALVHVFTGEAAGDRFGFSVSGGGDMDNDGYADVIVGAYGNDAGGMFAGRVYVYSGRMWESLWTVAGEAPGDYFGTSVADAGDVNGDGCADFVVGASYNDATGTDAGRAYVYSGKAGDLLLVLSGEAPGDGFGHAVAGAGDVNADGFADLVIGALYNDANGIEAGRAYVYSGRSGERLWTFTGESAGDWFKLSVSGAGDVNADGHADVIVGARANDELGHNTGMAYVFSGRTGISIRDFTGEADQDYLGTSISGASDINAMVAPI
jgi:hypothetical protein